MIKSVLNPPRASRMLRRTDLLLLLAFVLLCSFALLIPSHVRAHGPGAHIREADRVLELLAERDPEYAALAASEDAQGWLRLGSIAPDFQWISGALTFGHGKSLSYHLIDASEDLAPRYRLFALGHLTHILSDANAEGFMVPTFMARTDLGLLNIFRGQDDDLMAESETLCEGFGDLIFGEWGSVIDLLYDFHLDGEEAQARAAEMLTWYCETGEAFYQRGTDCALVVAQVQDALGRADEILGSSGRGAARSLIERITGGGPRSLARTYATGFLSFLLGSDSTPSEDHDRELARLRSSVMMERAFWDAYDEEFLDLAPAWTLDHLETRATGWPDWNANAIRAGNWQSMMTHLPDDYAVVPGLIPDRFRWLHEGEARSSVRLADEGAAMVAEVRLFSALPWAGTIRAVVRGDRPGFERADDPVLGEASVTVDIDPQDYTLVPRTIIEVPFLVTTEGVRGFYLDLHADDEARPFFTTTAKRLWTIPDLDMDRPIYRNNVRSYGAFPDSLAISDATWDTGELFVKLVNAPMGEGLEGVQVRIEPGGDEVITGFGGIAAFGGLAPGLHTLHFAGDHIVAGQVEEVEVEAMEERWYTFSRELLPRIDAPAPWVADPFCFDLLTNREAFHGQPSALLARAYAASDDAPLSDPVAVRALPRPQLCLDAPLEDGTLLYLTLETRYAGEAGEGLGAIARTEPFGVDASPPVVHAAEAISAACGEGSAPFEVRVDEPHAPVTDLEWREREGEWSPVEVPPVGDDVWMLHFTELPAGTRIELRAMNAAGLRSEPLTYRLPAQTPCGPGSDEPLPSAPESTTSSPDDGAPSEPSVAPDASETQPGEPFQRYGSCAAAGGGPFGPAGMVTLALLLARLRRRP